MKKEMILPAVFSIIFLILIGLYAAIFFILQLPIFVKVLIAIFLLLLCGVMIYLLIERNKEIDEEKENDISKY